MKIIPTKETIEALKKKASESESLAQTASEPQKSKLQDIAELCKEWANSLRTGTWIS